MTELKAVGASKWRLALAGLGALAFTAAGILMMTEADASSFQRLMGAVCALFFGFCFVALIYTQLTRQALHVGATGFAIGKPDNLKIVSWTDVEDISLYKISRQTFVVIALNNYEAYLARFSEDEAQHRAQIGSIINSLDNAIVSGDRISNAPPLPDNLSSGHRALAKRLIYTRQKYGGEFLLTWAQRDRPAEAFAAYLHTFVAQARV
ncbi:MAG: STM3941 family protein [Asticcacaulis sp.]